MSTQIFINPNQCKPEFTKIAAHSLYLTPSMNKTLDPNEGLFFGDKSYPTEGSFWSGLEYGASGSIISPIVRPANIGLGIPLPINLVPDDVVTISGSAYLNSYSIWSEANFTIDFVLGVFYFNCEDTSDQDANAYTFIPVQSFTYDSKSGTVCFEASVTLGSSYDIHNTRFLVGFNTFATCNGPGQCIQPIQEDSVAVSYTMDIQRPCAATITNFIIRNCCEPLITELVNIAGLTVGSFHVDDEGNCWEVMSASNDVTNFTRNFVDIYTSCVECQTANPCPQNLQIISCCVPGKEFVTGSLPGLNIGDTFVDNHGLCWSVETETGAPISEESITVDTEIIGDCTVCTDANPCPSFWSIESCCSGLREIIATSVLLDLGDSFVDTNGICWSVVEQVFALPTNYNIVVDSVYPYNPLSTVTSCEDCINSNPCPTEYFITVRACCDNDRVEVISVPSAYMSFSEGTIFRDQYGVCWEVMSYSTTGVETYPIDFSHIISIYRDCDTCTGVGGRKPVCVYLYQVRDCNTDIIYTATVINGLLTVGSYYSGTVSPEFGLGFFSCFEVLGYGYPTVDPLEVGIQATATQFATCEECQA